MASNLFIGIQTQDLPTITTAGITGSTINVGGLSIKSERGPNAVVEVRDPSQIYSYFGRFRSSYYSNYVMTSFFQNLQGESGKLYVKRQVPSDAVAASVSYANTDSPTEPTWKFWAGQTGYKDMGVWGNQLRTLVLASSRGSSTLTVATANTDTIINVASVAPFKLYDWVTVGATAPVSGKITKIDEATNQITVSVAMTGVNPIGEAVTIVDRTVKIYLKNSDNGNLDLVETISNLTNDPNSEHYFVNVINDPYIGSGYIFAEKLTTTETGNFIDLPVTTADATTNLASFTLGADGTALTPTQVAAEYLNFDEYSILYLSNTESFSEATWDDGEAYCNTRKDCVWVGSPTENMTFAQALVWANKRRKSRKIYACNNLNWIKVDDPIGPGALPLKNIPNIGHVMGYAIFVTSLRGIHKVPASRLQTLAAVRGLVGEIKKRDQIRDLANAGLNIISDLVGSFSIRSARTPSKLKEWTFVNAVLMSIYFKKSFEESLIDFENEPNTAALLTRIKEAMTAFAFSFYQGSSNGGGEGGFASFLKPGGAQSGFNDVVKIVADDTINPIQKVNDGELRVNFYFMAPPPAERILVGVGLLFLQ